MNRGECIDRLACRLVGAAVGLTLAAALAVPALAHGLFRDGEPADLVQDALLNFAVPLVVLIVGALAGVVLSRWLSRGEVEPLDEAEEAIERDEAKV